MSVTALGYIGIGASDIAAWRHYATAVLGVEAEDGPGEGLLLRIDERAWRIAIEPSSADDLIYAGWEVSGPDAFAATLAKLRAADIEVAEDGALAAKRGVLGLARFADPSGLVGELFWGPTVRSERPFVSPVGGSGFLTGEQGLGHVVLAVPDPKATLAFYRDLLGFRLSDFIDMPMGPEFVLPITFMHCNIRHHSLAFAPAPSPKKLIHFMLQTRSLDDVGFALDRLTAHGGELSMTLGMHVNDEMLSFYAYTPSGFEVEYGFGARTIDDATWSPVRHDRISKWGHKFVGRPGTPQA